MREILWILLVFQSLIVCNMQRVAPGVPPQQYDQYRQHGYDQVPQQPPHQQQQQYQQQQYQAAPQQQYQQQQQPAHQQQQPNYQQPVQQQQQHPQQHQQHQQQQQQSHHHHQSAQVLNTANIAHEKEHIAEHMEVPIDTSKMSEQELQFHYFKMHDADNNNMLDGCELIKSLIHWHDTEVKIYLDNELSEIIDPILTLMDTNNNGYIEYTEYQIGQRQTG